MAKRKQVQELFVVPEPQVGKRYRRTLDMSDQTYRSLQNEARRPSIGYKIFIISIATSSIALGSTRISMFGFTMESLGYVAVGLGLWILIIARIIRDRKERS